MKRLKTKDGVVMEVQVKPRSGSFRMQVNDALVVFCKQPPVEGKVDRELVKELSKVFGRRVEIVAGFRSRDKKVLIRDASEEDVLMVLRSLRKESDA